MRSSSVAGKRAAAKQTADAAAHDGAAHVAENDAADDEVDVAYDAYRTYLASTMISDMFEDHAACRFRDCRRAGRCLAMERAQGVCPQPLDMTRSLLFLGMIWFHEAMLEAAEAYAKEMWPAPHG